jgi:hypothetical protein
MELFMFANIATASAVYWVCGVGVKVLMKFFCGLVIFQ